MDDLYVFEAEETIWQIEGSVFDTAPPYKKEGMHTFIDADGKTISLNPDIHALWSYIRDSGDHVTISRYYNEEKVHRLLGTMGLRDLMIIPQVSWNKATGRFEKQVKVKEGVVTFGQDSIIFIGDDSDLTKMMDEPFKIFRDEKSNALMEEAEKETDREDKIHLLKQSIIIQPNNREALSLLGDLSVEEDPKQAIRWYKAANDIKKTEETSKSLARAYALAGDKKQSSTHLIDSISEASSLREMKQAIVDLIQEQRFMEAFELAKQTIRIVPPDDGGLELKELKNQARQGEIDRLLKRTENETDKQTELTLNQVLTLEKKNEKALIMMESLKNGK